MRAPTCQRRKLVSIRGCRGCGWACTSAGRALWRDGASHARHIPPPGPPKKTKSAHAHPQAARAAAGAAVRAPLRARRPSGAAAAPWPCVGIPGGGPVTGAPIAAGRSGFRAAPMTALCACDRLCAGFTTLFKLNAVRKHHANCNGRGRCAPTFLGLLQLRADSIGGVN